MTPMDDTVSERARRPGRVTKQMANVHELPTLPVAKLLRQNRLRRTMSGDSRPETSHTAPNGNQLSWNSTYDGRENYSFI